MDNCTAEMNLFKNRKKLKANSSTGNRKGISYNFLNGLKELHICANFGVRL